MIVVEGSGVDSREGVTHNTIKRSASIKWFRIVVGRYWSMSLVDDRAVSLSVVDGRSVSLSVVVRGFFR